MLTLVLMLLYFSVQRLADDGTLPRALGIAVMVLYMVSFGGLLIAYLIYNRAFIHKDVTVDMLPEDWPEDGEDALPDDQIPEPAVVPVSLFPESRPRRKWPWIAAGTVLLLTAGGAALWKTGLWARLLERLS